MTDDRRISAAGRSSTKEFIGRRGVVRAAMVSAETMARMPARTNLQPLTSVRVMSADCMRIKVLARM